MTAAFHKKMLTPPKRVCLRLKAAREESKISLEELATKTKINKEYLKALEECRFEDLKHAEIYQKNFIKRYAEGIGADPYSFMNQFCEEETTQDKKTIHPRTGCKSIYLSNLPNILRYGLVCCGVGILLIYLGLQVKHIMEAPTLSVFTPSEGFITERNTIQIAGETQPEIKVSVNGAQIKNDENGYFQENITLSPGVNTIIVIAQNKHGKTTQDTRHIIYKDLQQFSLSNTFKKTN